MSSEKKIHCDLCGHFEEKPFLEKDGGFYTKCAECGFVYTSPLTVDLTAYNDEYYKEVYGTDIVQRTEIRTDYLRNKYHLQKDMLFSPLTNKPFIFEIDTSSDESIFLVKSPLNILNEPYTESRFGIFTFEAGDHGYIKGSQKSWAE